MQTSLGRVARASSSSLRDQQPVRGLAPPARKPWVLELASLWVFLRAAGFPAPRVCPPLEDNAKRPSAAELCKSWD